MDTFQHRSNEPEKGPSNRNFGWTMAIAFTVIGLLPFLRGGSPRVWLVAIGAAFALVTSFASGVLTPLNRGWMYLGHGLQKATSPIFLGLIFFFVLTPMALLMRARGKRPLPLRPDPRLDSYWTVRDPLQVNEEYLKRQF